ARLVAAGSEFEELLARTIRVTEDPNLAAGLPLDIRGTAFQQRVWNALREIPVGQTMTYAALARSIGDPKATRAVARACATNSLAVAIPCHRVVRSDGSLSGYRWGIERKQSLLELEARLPAIEARTGAYVNEVAPNTAPTAFATVVATHQPNSPEKRLPK
ncbi:MAG TPA: methylated-DNA--[protein]-cysteine S-methyltransferase, partial [Polyangiaceae bacterium]